MEYRVLGKTGLNVSRMGFGGIPIQRSDAETAKILMHKLVDAGINFIDTARGYTVSEEFLGYGLEGIRDKFIIATKTRVRTKEEMAADIETSLQKLRTDYIDLYQVHNATPDGLKQVIGPGGALEALLEAKAAGKIRHIGVTAHGVETFRMALEYDWVETFMFPYNIVENQAVDLIRACREKNIGFINMKPLAGGAIEDATLALRYICANDDITVTIPGMADPRELEQNIAACNDSSPLSEEELAKIQEIRNHLGTQFCRRCNYCQPCPQGINISSSFLFEGYLERYGLDDWARKRYADLPSHASDCIRCGACESRCPYNLPIRDMLERVASKFGK